MLMLRLVLINNLPCQLLLLFRDLLLAVMIVHFDPQRGYGDRRRARERGNNATCPYRYLSFHEERAIVSHFRGSMRG
jgi:hypothetical protein